MHENKANKLDLETQMKAVDIMHKQITTIAVLVVEQLRQNIEMKTESKVEK